ncbi:hypothetical protein BDR26DRAFT_196118 [Obelidium mucronatum]|nr:hypothetical protein BDR26DRAFT_196118 [Obelidium mucronatum]
MVGTGKRLNEFSDDTFFFPTKPAARESVIRNQKTEYPSDMQQCSSQSEGQSNGCATEPVRLCTRNQDNQKKPQPIDTALAQAMSSDRLLSPQSVLVPSQANQTPLTTATVLDHCLNLLATPLIDQEMRRWTLEDPDLMPSIEDWLLVWRVSTQHGTVRPIHFSFDGEAFLKSFFFMPPVLRLTMCAVTAYYAGLPEDSIFNYYQRAKKAFLRIEQSKPTYQTIQSLFNIFLFGPGMQTKKKDHL